MDDGFIDRDDHNEHGGNHAMMVQPREPQRASVLIVVLWASFGLVAITLLFGHSMLMCYRGADNDVAGKQAEQAVEGVARYVESLLVDSETPGEFPDRSTYVAEEMTVGEAKAWIVGRSLDTAGGTIREYGIVDEASKLNLNTVPIGVLRSLPGMTEELAAAIIDWRDADDEVTESGAESSIYLAKRPAYECKNGPFETVEELALLNGATREIVYGEDGNLNGAVDPDEDDSSASGPEDNSDGKLDPGILEYVTVYTREPNKRADGTARINANPPADGLAAYLEETFGASRSQEILSRLGTGTTYTSMLHFYVRSGMTAEEFAKVSDAVTVTAGDYVPGLVNVNTASETVLSCIPGIGTEKASSLIAARTNRTEVGTDITWVVDVLGQEAAIQAGAFLTGKSYQVSADIAAVGRHGRGYRRTKFVIDQSTGTPRIVYRRNLSSLGWALGREIRQDLALQKGVR